MSVSTAGHPPVVSSRTPLAARSDLALGVEVLSSFEEAHALWDRLTIEGTVSAYQGFAWVESYFRHVEAAEGARAALIVLRDGSGEPLLLLPLAVHDTGSGRIARFIGGKHSNFHLPLIGRNAGRIDGKALRAALLDAGRSAGIDLYSFSNQPLEWEGTANPMALLGGLASPSAGYKLALEADGEAMLTARLSKDRRRKMRQKDTKLATLGTVTYRKAATDEEAMGILTAFFAQKAERFQDQGIDDPFASPAVRAFLSDMATRRDARGKPVLDLYALMLDERPVAIYGAVEDGIRYSGVVTAFDSDDAVARCTPGESLLMQMIRDCCARGLRTFDLGVGESRYKMVICDQTEPLIDTSLAVTLRGRLAALRESAFIVAKRLVKQSAPGQALIALVRKLKKAKSGEPSAAEA